MSKSSFFRLPFCFLPTARRFFPGNKLALIAALLAFLPIAARALVSEQGCGCQAGPDETVTVAIRFNAQFAGTLTTNIYIGGQYVNGHYTGGTLFNSQPLVMTAGSVQLVNGLYQVQSYGCGEWSQAVQIPAKLDQVIYFTTTYNDDPTNPSFTQIEPGTPLGEAFSQPSAPCLQYYVDVNGSGQFVRFELSPLSGAFSYPNQFQTALYSHLDQPDDRAPGDSSGPVAGAVPNPGPNPSFNDPAGIGSMCGLAPAIFPGPSDVTPSGASASANIASSTTAGTSTTGTASSPALTHPVNPQHFAFSTSVLSEKIERVVPNKNANGKGQQLIARFTGVNSAQGRAAKRSKQVFRPSTGGIPHFRIWASLRGAGKSLVKSSTLQPALSTSGSSSGKGAQGSSVLPQATVTPSVTPGLEVAQAVGALYMPLTLGYNQGTLYYSAAEITDATAYAPARLMLGSNTEPMQVITDTNGALRQVAYGNNFLDIRTLANGFQVRVYLLSQIGSFDGTVYTISDDNPSCIWTVADPDQTPSGRVSFTETLNGQTCVHLATWQPASGGNDGVMTVSYFNDTVVESRTYTLETGSNYAYRFERVQRRLGPASANNPLDEDTVNVYGEFYNWSPTGQVYEALIETVQDPDGAALTTDYSYYDDPGLPPRLLSSVVYPDGYWEAYYRYGGTGDLAEVLRPFMDGPSNPNLATESNSLVTLTTYDDNPYPGTVYIETDSTYYANPNLIVGTDVTFLQTAGSDYSTTIRHILDGANYSEEGTLSTNPYTGQILASYDTVGNQLQNDYYLGYWSPSSQSFSSNQTLDSVPAQEMVTYHGSEINPSGVANKTLIDETVTDQTGRTLMQESFVDDGSTFTPDTRTDWINRTINTYNGNDQLLATTVNGQTTYQAHYDANGRLDYEIDRVGVRTDYLYDAFGRRSQATRHPGNGNPDQVTTYQYDSADHLVFQKVAAGTLSQITHYQYDLAGRQTATITPDGLESQTTETYVVNGSSPPHRVVTETSPSGATTVTEYYLDRQVYRKGGTAIPAEYWTYGYSPSTGYKSSTGYRDSADQQLLKSTVEDWTGNVLTETQPGFNNAGTYTVTQTYNAGPNTDGAIVPLLSQVSVPGQANTLYQYDEWGNQTASGLDAEGTGTLDFSGTDPITTTTQLYDHSTGNWQHVTQEYRYLTKNSSTATLHTETRDQVSGLSGNTVSSRQVLDASGVTTVETVTVDPSTNTQITTLQNLAADSNSQPDTSTEVSGLLVSHLAPEAATATNYFYDGLGRLLTVSDPIRGGMTYHYNSEGQVDSATDSLSRITNYTYYPNGVAGAGQLATVKDPGGYTTYFAYTVQGQLYRQWGANIYPVQYAYDDHNRMTSLTTFRTIDAGQPGGIVDWTQPTWPANAPSGDTTTWVYDYASGLLQYKRYADYDPVTHPVQLAYNYDSDLRLLTRTDGRELVTTYHYDDNLGHLTGTTYSDSTPAVTLGYDRAGRVSSVTDGTGARTLTSTAFDQPAIDTYTAGLLNGASVTRSYDSNNRLGGLSASAAGSTVSALTYYYDSLSRLYKITDGPVTAPTHEFVYTPQPGSNQIKSVDFKRSGSLVMTTSRSYDSIDRLTNIQTVNPASQILLQHGYTSFDALDHRTQVQREDGKLWNYGYDPRGEVVSGAKQFPSSQGGQYLAGWQDTYAFDTIGNRVQADFGGNSAGSGLHAASYTPNNLNQYSSRDVPGYFEITGDAAPSAAVSLNVNGASQTVTREGPSGNQAFFSSEFQGGNSSAGVYGQAQIQADVSGYAPSGQAGAFYLPQSPENFQYDFDGNLAQDGRWNYTWDAENRLISMQTRPDIFQPTGAFPPAHAVKLDFTYDYEGRRIEKKVSTWNTISQSWILSTDLRYLYDGWNCLADLLVQTGGTSLQCSYIWGLDLSGDLYSAGGVGGLLEQTTAAVGVAGDYFYAIDGNGNVAGLINGANGAISAQYDYSPSGKTLESVGQMAGVNNYRFSSKYADMESGLVYYGRRYYNPNTGRWPSRDPIGETGGVNLYAFAVNNGINYVDAFGLDDSTTDLLEAPPSSPTTIVKPVPTGPSPGIPGTPDGPPIEVPPEIGVGGATVVGGLGVLAAGTGYLQYKAYIEPAIDDAFNIDYGPTKVSLSPPAFEMLSEDTSGIPSSDATDTKSKNKCDKVLIGENTKRVIPAALAFQARFYQPWMKRGSLANGRFNARELALALQRNKRWIDDQMRNGKTILDIGINVGQRARSPFYLMESQETSFYPLKVSAPWPPINEPY